MKPRGRRRLIIWGLVALMILLAPLELFILARVTGRVRNMYVPSEGMEPTLKKGDSFVAWTRPPSRIARGDILLIRVGENSTYVQRVAALPGDRIEMIEGRILINGRPVQQRRLGSARGSDGTSATVLSEQFPAEAASHRIYDGGYTPLDDMAEQRVAPGHIFLLGDNRDRSADSRVPREQGGVQQVPLNDVLGSPWFFTWTTDGGKFGRPAGH